MSPLPAPATPAAILAFDFDGTLHQPADNPPVPTAFFALIRQLRESQQCVWGINTGRSLEHLLEGLAESQFPFSPDWIIAREREIFFAAADGWQADAAWNRRGNHEIEQLFQRSEKLLEQIRHEIEAHTGAQWMVQDGEPAGIISRTEEEMEWIVKQITPWIAAEPEFSWQRNSIYLRFGHRDFQKGSSLCHLAEHYGLPLACRFAMGDSHNDLDMLDLATATMAACPANAVTEVKRKIQAIGGFIATKPTGEGVIEALQHYFLRAQRP